MSNCRQTAAIARLITALERYAGLETDAEPPNVAAEILQELSGAATAAIACRPDVVTRSVFFEIVGLHQLFVQDFDRAIIQLRSLISYLEFAATEPAPDQTPEVVYADVESLKELSDALYHWTTAALAESTSHSAWLRVSESTAKARKTRPDIITRDVNEWIQTQDASGRELLARVNRLINGLQFEIQATSRPQERPQTDWETLIVELPSLDQIGEWIGVGKKTFENFGRNREQLKELRKGRGGGETSPCGTVGIDGAGQIWRKKNRNAREVFYLKDNINMPQR